jgi:hypothetical protein
MYISIILPHFYRGGNFAFLSNEAKSFNVFEVKVLRKISGTKRVKIMGFGVVTPYSVVYTYQHFGGS